MVASGLRIEFAGFRRAYVEGTDDPEAELADQERILPALDEGGLVPVEAAEAKAHDTQPPDRYSEATLIKKLEDLGIGRPSTYASVMKTIDRRGYVWKKGKSLVPTFRAFAVVNLLEHYFADLVDYQFTAAMEDQLDEIAEGRQDLEPWLRRFYFGDEAATSEFARLGLRHVTHEPHDFDFAAINSLPLGVAPDGAARRRALGPLRSLPGARRGPRLDTRGDRTGLAERRAGPRTARRPERRPRTRPSTRAARPSILKAGRYGPYVQVGELGDAKEKPKTASLFSSMSPETLTLEDAKRLLSLPRVVGRAPRRAERSSPRTAATAPTSPGARRPARSRARSRSSPSISTAPSRCFAQPKQRGRRSAAKPLAELGVDPVSERPVVVRSGRFGLYVTDGETNATLRLGDTPETMTLDRACELLAERRNAEPSPRLAGRRRTKKSAKKPAKKTREEDGEEEREEGRDEVAARRSAPRSSKGAQAERGHRAARARRASREAEGRLRRLRGDRRERQEHPGARVADLHDALFTFEPGDTPLGRDLRHWVLDAATPMEPATEALMMLDRPLAPRAPRHRADARDGPLGRERPLLRLDPRLPGLRARRRPGAAARGERAGHRRVPCPTLTILLDVSLEVVNERRAHDAKDRFEAEDLAFHQRVREGYLELARRGLVVRRRRVARRARRSPPRSTSEWRDLAW